MDMAFNPGRCASCGETEGLAERRVVATVASVTVMLCGKCRDQISAHISERTRAGMAAAKARGVKVGGFHGVDTITPEARALGSRKGAETRRQQALGRALLVQEAIESLREQGVVSLNGLAVALTERCVPTPMGSTMWTPTAVRRVLKRLGDGA
jgi:hypothetical protein